METRMCIINVAVAWTLFKLVFLEYQQFYESSQSRYFSFLILIYIIVILYSFVNFHFIYQNKA